MKPLAEFPLEARRAVRAVLADIDDTLTTHGRLHAVAYSALERLRGAEVDRYVAAYDAALAAAYPASGDGSVLMPFRRLFLVLRRPSA